MPPQTIGMSGWRALTAFVSGTALASCGPGITVNAIARTGSALPRCAATWSLMQASGSMSGRLPSTISQFSPAGMAAPIAMTDRGKRLLAGLVARGLTRRIMAWPRSTGRNATVCVRPSTTPARAEAHTRGDSAHVCGTTEFRDGGAQPLGSQIFDEIRRQKHIGLRAEGRFSTRFLLGDHGFAIGRVAIER